MVTVARFTMDGGATTSNQEHLCGPCAMQERIATLGSPPEAAPAGPERFRPLHAHALQLLEHLEATYDVTRREALPATHGVLFPPEALRQAFALPPVLLTPRMAEAAPLCIAFTTPPSLFVYCGRWHEAAFGAAVHREDDLWTTSTTEAERLDDLVGKVVDGLFAEAVRLPLLGAARVSVTFGDGTPRPGLGGEGWMRISRDQARALVGNGPHMVRWRPWPRRGPAT